MLDAADDVLRAHYKSVKCDVSFSQGSVTVNTTFRWGERFSSCVKKFLCASNSAKIIEIDRDFPKLWSQMYCHLLRFTVYMYMYTELTLSVAKQDKHTIALLFSIRDILLMYSLYYIYCL